MIANAARVDRHVEKQIKAARIRNPLRSAGTAKALTNAGCATGQPVAARAQP
jgi:hypothetical protein